MPDRILTPHRVTSGTAARKPSLYELRLLVRTLDARIQELDGRVDERLQLGGPPFAEAAAEIDVLCAAIEEAQELLADAQAAIAETLERRQVRRSGRRRWR